MGECSTPFANKLAEAQTIVRALAATPVLSPDPSGVHWCVLCDVWAEAGMDIEHSADCVWAKAAAWVEAHPP